MAETDRLPCVVIVGRPNVGKSTLFNAITGSRRSIVGDEPGITRDRIGGVAQHGGKRFDVIDTGGIITDDHALIPSQILRQARMALEIADHIVFVIDGRTEITAADRELAQMLRKLNKPVLLAVNKIDTAKNQDLVSDFHQLGIEPVYAISAEHKVGIYEMLDFVCKPFPRAEEPEELEVDENGEPLPPKPAPIKVSIIGRPNVGKSTLINAIVGEERSIVSPVAGTTRDTVDEALTNKGVDYLFMDTAGIRRKGKTHLMAEKLSVVMARRHIRMAHVVLLVIDAIEGPLGQDATIAGYAHEEGRALIVVVNKWDAAPDKDRKKFEENLRDELKFLEYAQVAFLSAKTGAGVGQLFEMIRNAHKWASHRVGTGELNRFSTGLTLEPDTRIKYITQASIRPPTFIVFPDKKNDLHFSAERQLVNRLRRAFGFQGTPIVIKTKFAANPFEGMRKNEPVKRPPRNTAQKSVKRKAAPSGKGAARKAKSGAVRNKQKSKKQ
ncbi:MAG TPA: ribosome biogenesis GTPase Der [Bryobacteraceae bacterium]|nr:ribosome biogenesis GTPase Der [Bryobacteraceae bacterium]